MELRILPVNLIMPKRISDIKWLVNNLQGFCEDYGFTEDKLLVDFDRWKSTSNNVIQGDFIWHIFNTALLERSVNVASEEEMHRIHIDIYGAMIRFRVKREKKNANHICRLWLRHSLQVHASAPFVCEVEIISGRCCPYCNALNERKSTYGDALRYEVLASDQCTNPLGCSCVYAVIAVRDAHGRLIRRQ